jgi:hypothetical protein
MVCERRREARCFVPALPAEQHKYQYFAHNGHFVKDHGTLRIFKRCARATSVAGTGAE